MSFGSGSMFTKFVRRVYVCVDGQNNNKLHMCRWMSCDKYLYYIKILRINIGS